MLESPKYGHIEFKLQQALTIKHLQLPRKSERSKLQTEANSRKCLKTITGQLDPPLILPPLIFDPTNQSILERFSPVVCDL